MPRKNPHSFNADGSFTMPSGTTYRFTQPEIAAEMQKRHLRDSRDEMRKKDQAFLERHGEEVYGPDQPHSWFMDMRAAFDLNTSPEQRQGATERLKRYGCYMAAQYRAGTEIGQYAARAWRDHGRNAIDTGVEMRSRADAEFRAMTTTAGSGGPFVTPAWLLADFALYREAPPTFVEQACHLEPLPAYGMAVDLPALTGPATSGTVAENTGNDVDPTATLRSIPVGMYVGTVNASQQLHDRANPDGPEGPGIDRAIYAQLRSELDKSVDQAMITQALSGAQTLPSRSTFSIQGLTSDLQHAASLLQSTPGVRLAAAGAFLPATLGHWLLSQMSTTGAPAFIAPEDGIDPATGYIGRTQSGLRLFVDDLVPTSGANAQIIVAGQGASTVYRGEPIFDWLPAGAGASSLTGVYRCRQYVAAYSRFATGNVTVTGAAYPAAPVWA